MTATVTLNPSPGEEIIVAGLALALERDGALPDACRPAVAMGSAAAQTPGTELCHREEVERLLPLIEVTEMAATP